MSSQEIQDIETEVTRLTTLCGEARVKNSYHSYNHFRTRIQDLNLNLLALKDLEARIIALEP